jgi:hypothetical protein
MKKDKYFILVKRKSNKNYEIYHSPLGSIISQNHIDKKFILNDIVLKFEQYYFNTE